MPDGQATDNWQILTWLDWLQTQIGAWLQTHFLEPTMPHLLLQVSAVVVALFAARLFSHRLAPHTQRFAAGRKITSRSSLVARFQPVTFPLLWMLMLWFVAVALREAGAPVKIVEITLSLLAAWVGVRLATSFVASLFWSRVLAVGIVLVVALKSFGLWTSTLAILNEMAVTVGAVRVSVLGILEAVLILVGFWWAATLCARRLELWSERLPSLTPSERVLVGKAFHILTWAAAVLLALRAVGIDLTTLAVFSGAVGLGIGFGLQKIFSNLISGVILLLDRSVKPGDVIAIDGHYGWINALGARYVSVATRDGIEHLIPNEDLINDRVENWSHSNNLLRLRVPIGIAYSSDLHEAVALAEQASGEVVRALREPPPHCLVMAFGDSSVDLELRFWINDPRNGIHNVRSDVLKRVWDLYHEHNIELPFPQRDLHLRTAAPLPVHVVRPDDGPVVTAATNAVTAKESASQS